MLAAEAPATAVHEIHHLKSGRKPLHPVSNIPAAAANGPRPNLKPIPKQIKILTVNSLNKENNMAQAHQPPEYLNSSLAEELSAVREKLERLRIDRERTEGMLRERDLVMDSQLKEVKRRGEVQKELEIEVDRLYRLKQLQLTCLQRMSPVRSLRAQAMEKMDKSHTNVEVMRRSEYSKEESSNGSEERCPVIQRGVLLEDTFASSSS
ncbi:hypothetical protein Dimus_037738 [Dionaea muscipula]